MKQLDKAKHFIDLELKWGCRNYAPMPVVLERGQGPFLFDVNGKRYYDCLSAYSAVNQGHCRKELLEVLSQQARKVTLPSRAVRNQELGPFCKLLSQTFGYQRVLTMNTGVEAGESAVKLARRWGIRRKGISRPTVLFAKGNFWGRTLAACASSDDPDRYRDFGPFKGLNFKLVDFDSLPSLQQELKADKSICAFMVEPIQGERGVVVPSEDYLRGCKRLLEQHGALLISDEIQTGLGRTGKLLASEHWAVRPDIVTLGKSLGGGVYPISAVLADSHLMDLIEPGEHSSTYAGNPLACAVGKAALELLLSEKMCENSEQKGKAVLERLRVLFGGRKVDIRGKGLFIGIQFKEDNAKKFCLELMEQGVLAKPTHDRIVRFAPVLTLREEDVESIMGSLGRALDSFPAKESQAM